MKSRSTFEEVIALTTGIVGTLTAAGSGDNVEIVGTAVDTLDAMSAKLNIQYKATLAAGKSLIVTTKIADSDDGVTFGADTTLQTTVKIATSAAGATVHGVSELKIDLEAVTVRKRFLRFKITPDLDASGTDTATIAATLEVGGLRTAPSLNNRVLQSAA